MSEPSPIGADTAMIRAASTHVIALTSKNPGNSAGLGLTNATLIIAEDEISNGTIIFTSANYVVSETNDFATISLARTNGNQTHTGAMLGISRDQVRYKMEKHGLRSSPS